MAEFCMECSENIFGADFGDFANICEEGGKARVLCEGCGCMIWVDHTGKRIEPKKGESSSNADPN